MSKVLSDKFEPVSVSYDVPEPTYLTTYGPATIEGVAHWLAANDRVEWLAVLFDVANHAP